MVRVQRRDLLLATWPEREGFLGVTEQLLRVLARGARLVEVPAVLRSRQPWPVKLEACFHFGNWLTYPLGLLVALLILPQLMSNALPVSAHPGPVGGGLIGLLLVSTTALFYGVAQRQAGSPGWHLLAEVPVMMAISVGLALNNTRAIWEALCTSGIRPVTSGCAVASTTHAPVLASSTIGCR
jgi:hypothetical protein